MTMTDKSATPKPKTQTKRTRGKKAQQGPGRPKGSPNLDYADVVVIPPKCPSCHVAIDVKHGKKYKQVAYDVVHPNGAMTNLVRWYRTVCVCGQAISYRRYEFDEQYNPAENI